MSDFEINATFWKYLRLQRQKKASRTGLCRSALSISAQILVETLDKAARAQGVSSQFHTETRYPYLVNKFDHGLKAGPDPQWLPGAHGHQARRGAAQAYREHPLGAITFDPADHGSRMVC